MRALLITDWLAGGGGAEVYMAGVRDGLRAAGEDVRLLTSSAGSAGDDTAEYRAYGTDRLSAKAVLQIVNPFALLTLRSALREFRPEVVFLNMFEYQLSPGILAPLRRVPTVLMVSDYKGICPIGSKLLPSGRLCQDRAGVVCWRSGCLSLPHWLRDQPRYALLRAGRKHVNRVLACSRWVQRELEQNGVQSEHLTLPVAAPGRSFSRRPAAHPLFVYCGRLDRTKGLPLLLHAFARLRTTVPAAQLRIVGAGPERAMLEQLVQTLDLSSAVTFRGWVAPAEVEGELVDAWSVVVPSLWAEPLGLVALEAVVRGVPVIASGRGGLGEVVEHGSSGLLFPNGDEAELVRHLQAIARGEAFPSHSLPNAVSARAAERHSPSRHIDHLLRIFREIAPPSPPAGRITGAFPATTSGRR